MKEEGILEIKWLCGTENPVDLFTKKIAGPAFNKYPRTFVGRDEYHADKLSISEQGRVLN